MSVKGSSNTPKMGLDSGDMDTTVLKIDASAFAAWGPRYEGMITVTQLATRQYHYYGGLVWDSGLGEYVVITDGFIVCPDNAESVVQRDYAGVVTVSTQLNGTNLPMARVNCAGGVLVQFEDLRETALDLRGKLPPPGLEADLLTLDAGLLPVWLPRSVVNPAGYPTGPLPDPAECELLVDASDVGGVADGAAMTIWPDQSVVASDLSNTGGTDRPIYTAADAQDGLPRVGFDGVNDFFSRTGMTEYTGTEFQVYIVYRAGTIAAGTDGIFAFTKAGATDNGSASRFCLVRTSQHQATLVRNTLNYIANTATASGASAYDGAFTWGILAVRWKLVTVGGTQRGVLTIMHNNRIASFDLGASLTALGIVAVFLGCRHSVGDGTTPNLFTNLDVRHFSYKHTADTDLTMRDTLRYLAHQWGVPLLD